MERYQGILPGFVDVNSCRFFPVLQKRVDHDVSDEMDLRRIDAFTFQVFVGIPAGREKQLRDRVGHEAIDLFGHRPVAAA